MHCSLSTDAPQYQLTVPADAPVKLC